MESRPDEPVEPQPAQPLRMSAKTSTDTDVEQGHKPYEAPPIRASVPDLRPDTQETFTKAPGTAGRGAASMNDESTWGPAHPCFPHPNPHVPLSSPLYSTTRIIRIKRDWMIAGDLAPTFSNIYPQILEPLLSEDEFWRIIAQINTELTQAYNPWGLRNWFDIFMGVVTLWLWDDLGLTAVKGRLRGLEDWIQAWNSKVGEKEGVQLISLRRTGYMTVSNHQCLTGFGGEAYKHQLDIQIPVPTFEDETEAGESTGPALEQGSIPQFAPTGQQ